MVIVLKGDVEDVTVAEDRFLPWFCLAGIWTRHEHWYSMCIWMACTFIDWFCAATNLWYIAHAGLFIDYYPFTFIAYSSNCILWGTMKLCHRTKSKWAEKSTLYGKCNIFYLRYHVLVYLHSLLYFSLLLVVWINLLSIFLTSVNEGGFHTFLS